MNQTRLIESFDGTKLFTRTELPDKMVGVVVIVHGLAEHSDRYDALAQRLLAAHYGVYRFDQRGHARSEGQPAFYADFNQLPDDCHAIVSLAISEQPDLPIYVIGHSMGGFATTLFGSKYPDLVDGIITSGALTRYNAQIFGELPLDLPAETYLKNEIGSGVCSDAQVVLDYQNDPLVAKEFSVGLVNCLGDGIKWLKENPSKFVTPVLVLHGANDGLVAEKDSRDFYGEIASEDKTLKIYAHLFHEIFNEPTKHEIYTEIITWLNAH